MSAFGEYKARFDADDLESLAGTAEGLLWLKLRSIARQALLDEFARRRGLDLGKKTLSEKFEALFAALAADPVESQGALNRFIRTYAPAYPPTKLEEIASELHKMRHFSWGGDYANALDKFLVDRYVKRYYSFAAIQHRLAAEIPQAVNGYVLCSWYNHWSTILIENIFKQHRKVLPAIGAIKKVDFFIDDVPFDLKTTYLPLNFIDQKRKAAGLASEFTALKRAAKQSGIAYAEQGRARDAAYEIAEKIKVSGDANSRECLRGLRDFRRRLLARCAQNPAELIQNLYEKQGAMRFDAGNRLFVVLADAHDFDDSWKLKRNPDLLKGRIHKYLDGFSKERARNLRVTFTYAAKGGKFSALADAVFIVAE